MYRTLPPQACVDRGKEDRSTCYLLNADMTRAIEDHIHLGVALEGASMPGIVPVSHDIGDGTEAGVLDDRLRICPPAASDAGRGRCECGNPHDPGRWLPNGRGKARREGRCVRQCRTSSVGLGRRLSTPHEVSRRCRRFHRGTHDAPAYAPRPSLHWKPASPPRCERRLGMSSRSGPAGMDPSGCGGGFGGWR
jgi:hypothetical protein